MNLEQMDPAFARGLRAALVEEVIEVARHDVHPLDAEGLEVYRILRCTAPGLIHASYRS